MSYITREDGERFVIPSYRDVITVRNTAALKKEISLLCKSYGDYITLQKVNPMRYEAAFSPETGYLLGESIWHQLKRPNDLIYCEAIPGTSEAILVIVKDGSVYLDGRFPQESIPEELIIFLTQENHFEIYIYGDVPISQTSVEGKFSFEASSVKSFKKLDQPLFPTLPLIKAYHLQLMDPVLEAQGIGVLPVKKIMVGVVIVALLLVMWSFMSTTPQQAVTQIIVAQINPYQDYENTLASPAPELEISLVSKMLELLMGLPGWEIAQIEYANGKLTASVTSNGTSIDILKTWARRSGAQVDLTPNGIKVILQIQAGKRPIPRNIYPLKDVVANLTDKLAFVYPGNILKLGPFVNRGPYVEEMISVTVTNASPTIITLLGDQFKGLPLILNSMVLTGDNGFFTGTINLKAVGS